MVVAVVLGVGTRGAVSFTKSNITYTVNEDDTTVTITDCTRSSTKDLTIKSTVTNDSVTYTITAIGDEAFTVNKVASLTLPETLLTIGANAFKSCTRLTSVDMSACVNLTRIGECAFLDCDNKLTEVDLSNCASLVTIGDSAFGGCYALEAVTGLKDCTSLDTIGKYAFGYDSLWVADLVLPASVRYIGSYAFAYCVRLASIDLSACEGLTVIMGETFEYCRKAASLALPESIDSIGSHAFETCGFTGQLDLSGCVNLRIIGDYAFNWNKSVTTLTLPENLEVIDYAAFDMLSSLTTVYINNTTDMIDLYLDDTEKGVLVFANCSSLVKIYVSKPLWVDYIEDENWSVYKDYIATYVPGGAKAYLTIDSVDCYWGTYACDSAMDAPTDVKFYDVKGVNGSFLELTQVETTAVGDENVLPAGAYLVCAEEQRSTLYFFDYTGEDTVAAHESQYLGGCSDGGVFSEDGYTYYVLTTKNGVVGFYYQNRSKWTGTAIEGQAAGSGVVTSAYKAYLRLSSGDVDGVAASNGFSLSFADDDVTGVQEVEAEGNESSLMYDLQGRVVRNPVKGTLYIKNGRKYIR